MKHTHIHSEHADNIAWVGPDGHLNDDGKGYAKTVIDHFARTNGISRTDGQKLLDLVVQKLDAGLAAGTHECDDESHLPSIPDWDEDSNTSVDPAINDNWDKYEGEDSQKRHDISFGNDTMWLN